MEGEEGVGHAAWFVVKTCDCMARGPSAGLAHLLPLSTWVAETPHLHLNLGAADAAGSAVGWLGLVRVAWVAWMEDRLPAASNFCWLWC